MKKIIVALALALAASAAMSTEIGVSAVRDYNLNSTGARATVSVDKISGFKPQASITSMSGAYNRYAVGADYSFGSIGPVTFSGTGSGVFQQTKNASSGYGLNAGLLASMPVYKNVSLDASVERFFGQKRISNFDGISTNVGLSAKF